MAAVSKKKNTKPKKKLKSKISAHELEKRRFARSIAGFFQRLDFDRVKTEGKQFTFRGRTGELDDVFMYENIVVIAEYTVGQPSTEHAAKKNLLWELIRNHPEDWVQFLCEKFAGFKAKFESSGFEESDYRIRICYFSKEPISEEVEACIPKTRFLDLTTFRYFDALGKTIHKSAKFELFKYLEIEFKEIGQEIKSSSNSSKEFKGFLLPATFSSFPKGFQVASFYADPNTLLSMSYVLRRDSWRDPEGMYQRVLMKGRMNEMRKYLTNEERVFINNIIVTLPNDTKINDINDPGKNLQAIEANAVKAVTIAVPHRSNVIGIVDGQHRVYCYHEGIDSYEKDIKKLRTRQNLLVTGIIYPHNYPEADRQRFEAKLFLEINDKQKKAKSDLRQSIELILNPYANISIAKRVVERLNAAGALKGLLQTNYFDPPRLIRTASIVSFGLRPLVKIDGTDSLFRAWSNANKSDLKLRQKSGGGDAADLLLSEYIDFCVGSINALLIAAKKQLGSKWKLADKPKDRELTPTLINGLCVCMRLLVEKKQLYSITTYDVKLKDFASFDYKKYKSSHWGGLGAEIFDEYFK